MLQSRLINYRRVHMELKITTTEAEKILLEWAQARFPDAFNAVEIKTYSYSGEIKFTKEETPDAAQN